MGFNIARSLVAERLGVPLSTAPGPRSNSGEGGQLSSSALSSLGMGSLGAGAASRQTIASIVQVASGRWMGESPLDYLVNAEEIDIKVAQGVKPGDGGHLPASKTTPLIAEVRGAAPYRDLYSPPPHHDIYSVEDLAQLIHDLRQVNPLARKIWVKLASRSGVGPVSLVVAKAGAGVEVTGFGGTGAAKAESKHFYVRDKTPGILEVRNTLIAEGLWPIDLAASGRIQTPEDIAQVVFMGANRINMGTPLMLANGCVKADSCQNDDCPVGIATQQEALVDKFPGKPENVIRFLAFLAKRTQRIFDQYGLDFHSARGRTDLLEVQMNRSVKTGVTELLQAPEPPAWARSEVFSKAKDRMPHDLYDKTTEQKLLAQVMRHHVGQGKGVGGGAPTIPLRLSARITNKHRTFGALIAGHVGRDHALAETLANSPLSIQCEGVGGLSFGMALPDNISITMQGPVNHGAGKALSGGTVVAQVMGDQAGYGAGKGTLMARSMGDRAAIRSYKLDCLVETTGDMSSCYRTGGHFFVLGHPSHYPDALGGVPGYQSMDLWAGNPAMGPGIGGGMGSGVIILPNALHEENVRGDRYAAPLCNVVPRPLNAGEAATFSALLSQYAQGIRDNHLAVALLEQPPGYLSEQFCVLDPLNLQQPPPVRAHTNASWGTESQPGQGHPAFADNWATGKARLGAAASSNAAATFNIFEHLTETALPRGESDACGVHFLSVEAGYSRGLVDRLLDSLCKMKHRAGFSDPTSSDGAGINLKVDPRFWEGAFPGTFSKEKGATDGYAVVATFWPENAADAVAYGDRLTHRLEAEGLAVAAFRDVPMNTDVFGVAAMAQQLPIRQYLVHRPGGMAGGDFEMALLKFQTRTDYETLQSRGTDKKPSIISAEPDGHVIYKGLMSPNDLAAAFPELADPAFRASQGLVHNRFCTNAPKGLDKIQPLSVISNNGEMNSLPILYQFMTNDQAFQGFLGLDIGSGEKARLWDETAAGKVALSDSYLLSVYLRFLLAQNPGRPLAESIASLIPNVVNARDDPDRYLASLLADVNYVGPLAGIFTWADQVVVGCDPNGFRPLCATKFEGSQGEKFLQFSSEWLVHGEHAKYSVVHPGQVLELDTARHTIRPVRGGAPRPRTAAAAGEEGARKDKGSSGTWPDRSESIYHLPPPSRDGHASPLQKLSVEVIAALKPMVGWNDDNDRYVRDLCSGKLTVESMGFAGPTASEVRGNIAPNHYDLLNHSFAQVSNPPLAWREEGRYMTLDTRVGPYLLPSPFLSNALMNALQAALPSKKISTTFPVNTLAEGMKGALQRIMDDVLVAVKGGRRFLVLSELDIDPMNGPAPLNMVVGSVNQALQKLGMRKDVHLAVQTITAIRPGHFSQLLAMGADTVHPALLLDPRLGDDGGQHGAAADEGDTAGGQRPEGANATASLHAHKVLSGCDEGLRHYMSTVGVGSVSAYRGGSHVWQAETLNADCAALMGLQPPRFSGIGFGRISKWLYTTWRFPSKNGPGLYNYNGQRAAMPVWSPDYTRAVRRLAAGEDSEQEMDDAFDNVDVIKRNAWSLSRLSSTVWGPENPMNVCIIGGGAAGYFATDALLNSALPVNVTMVEKNAINGGGVVYKGLSPLHHSTKKNTLRRLLNIHKDGMESGNFNYAGGVEISGPRQLRALTDSFPVVIDASGSTKANRLTCPGAEHAIEAAAIYNRYNRILSTSEDDDGGRDFSSTHWHGSLNRFNRATVVVGGGNVAFDVLSVLTLSKHIFEPNTINQQFIEARDEYGSTHVVSVIRKMPWELASDIHVLKEFFSLMEKSKVKVEVSGVAAPGRGLTAEEQEKLDLFIEQAGTPRSLDSWPTARDGRSVHFRFGHEVDSIENRTGGLLVAVRRGDVIEKEFQAYQVIEAMGYQGDDKFKAFGDAVEESPQLYQVGWANTPGNLASAEASAVQIVEEIGRKYHVGTFHGYGKRSLSGGALEPLLASAPVDTNAQKSVFQYLLEQGRIETPEDYFAARQYQSPSEVDLGDPVQEEAAGIPDSVASDVREGYFAYADGSGEPVVDFIASDDRLDIVIGKTGSCDGAKTCLDCLVEVSGGVKVASDPSETRLLSQIGMFKPNRILSCCHSASEISGGVVTSVSE